MKISLLCLTALVMVPAEAQTVPANTYITVRTIDRIEGSTASPGRRFRATVDEPVNADGREIIPRGSPATLEVAAAGSGNLALRVLDITVNNRAIPVSSTDADFEATGTSRAQTSARRGVGLGALGAGVGAIAGGGRGAAIGAAVGGGVGATTGMMSRGRELNVPSETRLRVALTSPVTVR
jgi:hypothetical protein